MVLYKASNERREASKKIYWGQTDAPGSVGKIDWQGLKKDSICADAGVSRTKYAVTPEETASTVPAPTCDELAKRFENIIEYGRKGKIYARLGTVPGFQLECVMVGLHEGYFGDGMVFSSGMGAINAVLKPLLTAGDNIVVHQNIYGCSDDLFSKEFPASGINVHFEDLKNPRVLRKVLDKRTRAIFFETPSNPALDLIDISAIAEEVKRSKFDIPIIVDNTFQSPMGQILDGVHMGVYSMTKSIAGHSNAIGGAVVASGKFMDQLFVIRTDCGWNMAAREASSILEGVKTLAIRYDRMQSNAVKVTEMLVGHPEVKTVHYPLFDKRYPALEGKQMLGPGYVIAFELKKGIEGGKTLIDSIPKIIVPAVSLGSVESLICHPASTTHARVPEELRNKKGITKGLVRLSVGIGNWEDIVADLKWALKEVAKL